MALGCVASLLAGPVDSVWSPGGRRQRASPMHLRRARGAFFITAYLLLSKNSANQCLVSYRSLA